MTSPVATPYGSWQSPITATLIASGTLKLLEPRLAGDDTYWIEMRPEEEGRYVIVRRCADGTVNDVTPPPYGARTRVHEYGGGAYLVDGDTVYFSNWHDQLLYRQDPGEDPLPIAPQAGLRYADGVVDRLRGRLVCIREDHTVDGEPANAIVGIDLAGGQEQQVLASGNDFYASPRISPDGSRLAWLTWNHPNMPWNGTELWVSRMRGDGSLQPAELVAGGADESIFQPEWSPSGVLTFVSDRTGWWNLYIHRDGQIEPLVEMEAEFGRPQWVFGLSTYGFVSGQRLVCAYCRNGLWHLASVDTETRQINRIVTRFTELTDVQAHGDHVVFRGGSPTEALSLVQLNLKTGRTEVLRRSTEVQIDTGYLSAPETVDFPTGDGLTAHAFFYPPTNRDYVAVPGERPPLLVVSHGGPTGEATSTLNLEVQYWTSRGIAVLDVNYRGSSGYGRRFRQALEGNWGVADVEDCAEAALHLVEQDRADGGRLIIRGGSAGGYTTLCVLTFRNDFKAGASYFGVSDLEALTSETHKFESRYLDQLVGPYPEARELYYQRSPIHYIEQLSCPVIFFQGLEDKVVPAEQAEMMVAALRTKGVPVAYIAFEGEQHGFRRAQSIKRALEAELYFYSRVFGFELAGPAEAVEIQNLDG
ncbi:MAG: S9 family peptidase [Anaerolineae bacterium]|jgi:dipeptidyl aminopeptidase/acylaminoacyl peptidase